ncbi:MAG: hypothetical protein ACE5I5_20780 [Candidatus Heimdallarchaeota archaeon]
MSTNGLFSTIFEQDGSLFLAISGTGAVWFIYIFWNTDRPYWFQIPVGRVSGDIIPARTGSVGVNKTRT